MTVSIHPTARISNLCDIEASTRGTRITIGARSVVDSFVKFKPAGGTGDVVIGEDCVINSGCVLYAGNGIRIGCHVAVAANCVFAPVNHAFADAGKLIRSQGFQSSRGGIVIEDDVWIGAGCVLLDGTHIGRGAVIGAMSLVRGDVTAYGIHVGNPLRQVGQRQ